MSLPRTLPMRLTRRRAISFVFGELCRYWIISGLMYFIAVGAEIVWLQRLIEIYIIGLPIAFTLIFAGIFAFAMYFFALNRWSWERPVHYIGLSTDKPYQQRLRRLSLTDVQHGDYYRTEPQARLRLHDQ